eukprot:SAG31_NODE_21301_length_553_cov_0.676211_2_plen_72_part_01
MGKADVVHASQFESIESVSKWCADKPDRFFYRVSFDSTLLTWADTIPQTRGIPCGDAAIDDDHVRANTTTLR